VIGGGSIVKRWNHPDLRPYL